MIIRMAILRRYSNYVLPITVMTGSFMQRVQNSELIDFFAEKRVFKQKDFSVILNAFPAYKQVFEDLIKENNRSKEDYYDD
jgi:hypothetical protein